jgi:hypothetical protein
MELVRKEMIVAFPPTAEGTKWSPCTWIWGLPAAAEPPRKRASPPSPKMNRSVIRSLSAWALSGVLVTERRRRQQSQDRMGTQPTFPPGARNARA